ncbi:MAG TPA: hypothetical protein VNQ54_11345 [Methylomirabilota bacterium]|jgi:hypothetical protein|nr:hypothetical protein [Methylomirabilota bacterium]
MGIRRSHGKNKKSNEPTDAATVERQDILRRAANVRSRFDSTRRGQGAGTDGTAGEGSPSQDEPSTPKPPDAPAGT